MNVFFVHNNNNNDNNNTTPRPASEFARAAYAEALQAQFGAAALGDQVAQALGAAIGGAFPPTQTTAAAADWSEDKAAPPIAAAALRRLPVVRLTEEDLADAGNECCCVCLDRQRPGDAAAKLPCGHVYHKTCIVGWLQKHATCPNCRFELETECAAFERGRTERMRRRKPRLRRRELDRLRDDELRDLLRRRVADATPADFAAMDRASLLRRLVDGGLVDLVAEPPPLELACTRAGLARWPARDLKRLMARLGVDSTACVEKADLVDHLVRSGRVDLLLARGRRASPNAGLDDDDDDDDPSGRRSRRPNDDDAEDDGGQAALLAFRAEEDARSPPGDDFVDNTSTPAASSSAESASASPRVRPGLTRADLEAMSIRELKAALRDAGRHDELRRCIDKDDLRRALADALGLA